MEIFRAQNAGHLVVVSSVAADRGLQGAQTTYAATKAALSHLAEGIRVDVADTPIRRHDARARLHPHRPQRGHDDAVRGRRRDRHRAMVDAIERARAFAYVPTWPWAVLGPAAAGDADADSASRHVTTVDRVAELKERLRTDLTTAMKARDQVRVSTIRMALSAINTEEVAGEQHRELSDDEVTTVLGRESKKRRESAEAFDGAGRTELAERERAEQLVLADYLPTQLSDDDLTAIVAAAIAETGAEGPKQMGAVMKVVQPKVAGQADGRRVSGEVKRQLSGS